MKYILTLCLVSLIQGNASEIPKKNSEVKSLLEKRKAKQEAFQKEQKILEKRKAFKEKHEAKQNVKSNEAAFKEEADSCLKTVQKISKNSELLKSKYDVKHKYNFKQNSLETSFEDEKGKYSTSFSCLTGKMLQNIKHTHKPSRFPMPMFQISGQTKQLPILRYKMACIKKAKEKGFEKLEFHYTFKNNTLYWVPAKTDFFDKEIKMSKLEKFAKQSKVSIKSFECPKFKQDDMVKEKH